MEKKSIEEETADPFISDANMERLRKTVADVESGKSTLKEHDLIDDDKMITCKTPAFVTDRCRDKQCQPGFRAP